MAKKVKELQFTVKNKIGALAQITEALKAAKVNMLHIAAWGEGAKGYFNLITENNGAAKKALKKAGIRVTEQEVMIITLRNKVGSLDHVAKRLAKAKIDIKGLSATTGGKRVAVMINTKNNGKAARMI